MPTLNANSNGSSDFFGFPTPPNSNGVAWLGSWWPTSGYRNSNSATLGDVGYYGGYWSASPSSTAYNAYRLGFVSGHVNPVNGSGYRSYGFSLRCVQE